MCALSMSLLESLDQGWHMGVVQAKNQVTTEASHSLLSSICTKPSVNKSSSSLQPEMSGREKEKWQRYNNVSDSLDRNPSENSLGFGGLIHFESLRSPCFYPVVVMLPLLSLAPLAAASSSLVGLEKLLVEKTRDKCKVTSLLMLSFSLVFLLQ